MSRRHYVNSAPQQTITSSITSGATSLVVPSFVGWPSSFPFFATLDLNNAGEEIVSVTNITGTTATIVRAQDGTTAVSHPAGVTFDFTVGAQDFDEANAHVNASTGVHGISGAVVGTTDIQTITNKTFTAPTFANPSITGTVGGNASYTAPTITSPTITGTGTAALASVTTTGAVTAAGAVNANGAGTGLAVAHNATVAGTLTVTGTAATGALTVSGTCSATSVASGSTVTGGTMTAVGTVQGATVTSTGAINGASEAITGASTAATYASTGTVTAGAGVIDSTASFVGTPQFGSFSSAKAIRAVHFHASGTSDGTNGLFTVAVPTASCILSVPFSDSGGSSMASLVKLRTDLFSSTQAAFQTRSFAGAAVASTAYDVSGVVYYQV